MFRSFSRTSARSIPSAIILILSCSFMAFLIRAARAIPVSPSGRSLINRPFFICNPSIIVIVFVKIINFVRYLGVEGYYTMHAQPRVVKSDFFSRVGGRFCSAPRGFFAFFATPSDDGTATATAPIAIRSTLLGRAYHLPSPSLRSTQNRKKPELQGLTQRQRPSR